MAIAVVTILYAWYVAKNPLIAAVAGLNVLAQGIVLCYGVLARLAIRPASFSIEHHDNVWTECNGIE